MLLGHLITWNLCSLVLAVFGHLVANTIKGVERLRRYVYVIYLVQYSEENNDEDPKSYLYNNNNK